MVLYTNYIAAAGNSIRYQNKGTPGWYGNATVPNWDAGCWNTDAGGMGLNADAQLWEIRKFETNHLIMRLLGEIRTMSLALSCKEGMVWCWDYYRDNLHPPSAQLHNPSKIFSIIQDQGRKTLISAQTLYCMKVSLWLVAKYYQMNTLAITSLWSSALVDPCILSNPSHWRAHTDLCTEPVFIKPIWSKNWRWSWFIFKAIHILFVAFKCWLMYILSISNIKLFICICM